MGWLVHACRHPLHEAVRSRRVAGSCRGRIRLLESSNHVPTMPADQWPRIITKRCVAKTSIRTKLLGTY